jgi:hypothetical protein
MAWDISLRKGGLRVVSRSAWTPSLLMGLIPETLRGSALLRRCVVLGFHGGMRGGEDHIVAVDTRDPVEVDHVVPPDG